MKKSIKILILIIILAGTVSLAEFFYFQKHKIQSPAPNQSNISEPQQIASIPENNNSKPETNHSDSTENAPDPDQVNPLPAKYLLEMPFFSQAPMGKWDAVHEEMCEEASVLNGALYLLGKKLATDQFEAELQKFKKLEEKELGVWESTTIAELKKVTDLYFEGKIKSKIVDNPSIKDIESEIAAGHPVIVPLVGRDIGNPNFTPPGPVYHMLVLKGYDAQNFITNDVGTRKGNSYTYKKEVIMKNMHDWNEKDIHFGTKKILVLFK